MGEKNTTDVLFKRDTLENINNTPLKDGQVLWTIDQEGNDKIYNDVKQSDGTIKRTQIGGTVQVDQNFDKGSPYPLANKIISKFISPNKIGFMDTTKDYNVYLNNFQTSSSDFAFKITQKQNSIDKFTIKFDGTLSTEGSIYANRLYSKDDIYAKRNLSVNNYTTTKDLKVDNRIRCDKISAVNDELGNKQLSLRSNVYIGINDPALFSALNLVVTGDISHYGNIQQLSDSKLKSHIAYLKDNNKLEDFYMNLKPVEYKWKNNGRRTHLGFYAQDVAENANNTIGDLSMFQAVQIAKDENGNETETPYNKDVDDKDLKWSLNYTELIAPTVAMVQKQQKEIEELKQQIDDLKR